MIKDFVCKGCKKGPCRVDQTAVRPVLIDYVRSYGASSDWWKRFDFVRNYQCLWVINNRTDVFQCDFCGFLLENHMLYMITDSEGDKWHFCPDCYERLKAQ